MNSFLLAISCVVCLVLAELLLRLSVDEVDYLRPELITHPYLRHAIKPYSAGHDKWGFRNLTVPDQVDVVAIGDSFTYGVSATASESWPSWLQRLSGKEVYNLGLGGYSLDDYWWLLQNKVSILKPKQVYIGVYLGNDLITGAKPAAAALNKEKGVSWSETASRKSVLYQFVKLKLAFVLAPFKRQRAVIKKPFLTEFEAQHINTLVTPERFLSAQDINRKSNKQRLNVAMGLLEQITKHCKQAAFDCIFLFIPTKTAVYQSFAEQALADKELSLFNEQVLSERQLFKQFSGLLEIRQQPYVDLLPALRAAANNQALYPVDDDNHLLGRGYKVVALEVFKKLEVK